MRRPCGRCCGMCSRGRCCTWRRTAPTRARPTPARSSRRTSSGPTTCCKPAPMRGEVVNLGTGAETSLEEVVRTVLDLLGSRSEVHWGATAARHWDSTRWAADAGKAKALLGWEPRHTLRQGLARTAAWMEAT